jgi:hypothetical protein
MRSLTPWMWWLAFGTLGAHSALGDTPKKPIGKTLKTSLGVARRVQTPDGETFVVERPGPRHDSPRELLAVTQQNGEIAFDRIKPYDTPYGQTRVRLGKGKLQHTIEVGDETYQVYADREGKLSYVDRRGRAHPQAIFSGPELQTPHGVTRTLQTSSGRQHVLITDEADFSAKTSRRRYTAVVLEDGELAYEQIKPMMTTYGEAQLVVDRGRLVERIKVANQAYEVSKNEAGRVVFTDSSGRAHIDLVHIGKHIVTPEGVTQTLQTAEGEREVLVNESKGSAAYRAVSESNGQLGYSPISYIPTPYGTANLVVDKGKVRHVLEFQGQRYRVTRGPGNLIYSGPRGAQQGAIFVGPHIETTAGLTRTMRTPAGTREVVVRNDMNGSPSYQIVEVRGQPSYSPLTYINTPYGNAQVIAEGDRLFHQVEIDKHKYEVRPTPGGGYQFLDEHGTEHKGTIRVGEHLRTPAGLTTTLRLRDGAHEVLVTNRIYRSALDPAFEYQIVRLGERGESLYEKFDGLVTPYGRAKVEEKDGVLRRTLTWQGKTYDVDPDPEHGMRFIDEHGNVQRGALFEGKHIVTSEGPTRTMNVDGVPQEVRIQIDADHPQRKTGFVYRPDGALQPEQVKSYQTPFGEAEAIVEGDQLVHRLQINDLRLVVSRVANGDFIYTDARGQKHQGAIAFAGHWLTPDGVTRSRLVAGGVHEVIERKDHPGRYELARVVGNKVELEDLRTLHTAYGDAQLHVEGDKLDHQIKIGDHVYHAVFHGERVDVIDDHGERYLDPFLKKVESNRAAPVTARRVRSKAPLAALSDGPIVEIAQTKHMARPVYDQLRDAMIEAMTMYDLKTHYFIGLGSDPHPILAFLENIGGRGLATNFPASGKGYDKLDPMVLDAYVRRLIPPEVLNGSKTLVFIDQTESSATREGTLAQVSRVFEAYLRRIGCRAKIERLAFSPFHHPDGTGVVDTGQYPEVGKFLKPPYEHVVSEYDRHVLGSNKVEQLLPRPAYEQFKAAMLERMKRDDKLDAFLRHALGE